MKKKLILAGICGALARFCTYTLYSVLLSVTSHSFAITGPLSELWSNVFSYVIEIGCWLISALIMLIFAFLFVFLYRENFDTKTQKTGAGFSQNQKPENSHKYWVFGTFQSREKE